MPGAPSDSGLHDSVESVVDAIEAMARSLLTAFIRNGTLSVEEALAVFDDARSIVEPEHGTQSPGAIMIRSIYKDLEAAFRETHPSELARARRSCSPSTVR